MKIKGYRWVICGLVWLATVISYVDRQAVAIAAPVITRQFGLNDEQLAQILSVFILAYAIGHLFAGRLFDWIGPHIAFAISIGWWSLANTLTSVARGFWGFTFFRIMLGIGESGNFPGGIKVVREWFPFAERPLAAGLFTSGASIGAIVAGPLIATIIHFWGWRAAFVATGSLGFIWLAAWLMLYDTPERSRYLRPEERQKIRAGEAAPEHEQVHGRWVDLLKQRQVWALIAARFLEEPVYWMYLFWLPDYMVKVRGLPLLQMGWLLTIPFITLDIGYIGGGWVTRRLLLRNWDVWRAKILVMTIAAGMMVSSIAVSFTGTLGFVICVSLATLGHGSWASNLITIPADISPRGWVASVYAISAFGGSMGGVLFTQLTGIVSHRLHTFTPIFIVGAFLPLIGAETLRRYGEGQIILRDRELASAFWADE